MKLSVIVVNYNVRFFLEQCLQSVFRATKNIDAEVFVVDNNSVDGSVGMVREKFPNAILIENERNLGFSTANNIAIKKVAGEYILLLNPDTVVEEDTFGKAIAYMDFHSETGALGVKMIDGKGNFLPESKRGLPTPWVAFYKIFGLSKIFPNSKKFGKYHLSFLDKNKTHSVDVLCGAFMLIRRTVLDKVGLLDETFFMYGEDIDLSFRIQKAGYQNVYFPETTIIHYKGESTRKSSLNYVYLFYKAMQIFAQKHLSGRGAWLLTFFIHFAIYFRASLAMLKRITLKLILPIADVGLMYFSMVFLSKYWGSFWFGNPDYYTNFFLTRFLTLYVLIWCVSLLFSGAYDKPVSVKSLLTGISSGTLIILIVYALLPQEYHFSRVIILSGALLSFVITLLVRFLFSITGFIKYDFQLRSHKRVVIVGLLNECTRVKNILEKLNTHYEFLTFVSPGKVQSTQFVGTLTQLNEIVEINKINEVIFCSSNIPASEIINQMLTLSGKGCDFKIAPADTDTIIGSNSITSAGDVYVHTINSVASARNIRLKRTFDIAVSLLLVISIPFWIWFKKKPSALFHNTIGVLVNKKTWIGYSLRLNKTDNAPKLKQGIYSISEAYPGSENDKELLEKLDLNYAQNYSIFTDARIFIKCFFNQF